MPGFVVGGGIVGLTTALKLHRSNVEVRVFEEAPKIKELGVGLNLLRHSVQHLVDPGLHASAYKKLAGFDKASVNSGEN
jgi:2-polyprenyl-6-methoxyphenol hydroxylase-like FAD-dependent oxidoreductase